MKLARRKFLGLALGAVAADSVPERSRAVGQPLADQLAK